MEIHIHHVGIYRYDATCYTGWMLAKSDGHPVGWMVQDDVVSGDVVTAHNNQRMGSVFELPTMKMVGLKRKQFRLADKSTSAVDTQIESCL